MADDVREAAREGVADALGPDEAPALDPDAVRRAYQAARARRRARVEHRRRTKLRGCALLGRARPARGRVRPAGVDDLARDRAPVRAVAELAASAHVPSGSRPGSPAERVATIALVVLIAVVVPPMLVVNAFRVLATDTFVRWELGRDGFPPDRYGLTHDAARGTRAHGSPVDPAPARRGSSLLERATLPDGSPGVRRSASCRTCGTCERCSASHCARSSSPRSSSLALALALARTRLRAVVPRGLLGGRARSPRHRGPRRARSSCSASTGFFTRFHEVFFTGDSWRFSNTDTLIRLYPELFWQDVSRLAAAIAVGQALVLAPLGLVVARGRPRRGRGVIDLRRRDRAVCCGSATAAPPRLAPENTLRSFREAVAHGVDLVEFDVLDLPRGPLVLAHSDRLDEVSHGAAGGSVRGALARGAPRGRARAADARGGARVLRRRGAGGRAPRRPEADDAPRRARRRRPPLRARPAHGGLVVPRAQPARGRAGRAVGAHRVHLSGGSLRRLAAHGAAAGRAGRARRRSARSVPTPRAPHARGARARPR